VLEDSVLRTLLLEKSLKLLGASTLPSLTNKKSISEKNSEQFSGVGTDPPKKLRHPL
jgi:hypothetical protein